MHSVVERRPLVPPGVAPVTNRKRLRAERFGVEEATWEPFSAFVLPEGRLKSVLVDYLSLNNLGELLRLAETLASQKKPRD